jgi:hypothetical protein
MRGGHAIDIRKLALEVVTLPGHADSFRDGQAFRPDLPRTLPGATGTAARCSIGHSRE